MQRGHLAPLLDKAPGPFLVRDRGLQLYRLPEQAARRNRPAQAPRTHQPLNPEPTQLAHRINQGMVASGARVCIRARQNRFRVARGRPHRLIPEWPQAPPKKPTKTMASGARSSGKELASE